MGTVTIPHAVSEDAIVGGCLIPKGSQVIGNIWAVHHNPLDWDEPDKFNPCRFLSKDGSALVLPANFMPFGVGKYNGEYTNLDFVIVPRPCGHR